MVILKDLQVKSQTSSYLGQPPTRKETFSTEHIKTSGDAHAQYQLIIEGLG